MKAAKRQRIGGPTMADDFETADFCHADREIACLRDKLKARGLCSCCIGRALLLHGASMLEQAIGAAEAAELCEEVISALRLHVRPAPDAAPPSLN
jgi:hypothetical protein